MFEVEEDFKELHDKIVKTYEYLSSVCDDYTFKSYPIDMYSTEFQIESPSGKKISVSHPIATGGDLETIIINHDGKKRYDTLEYHDSRENLANYLQIL